MSGAGRSQGARIAVGGQIGRYTLADKLGAGSFGVVFRAHDTVLDRMVAIKVLSPQHQYNADVLRRFLQEALASARVVHPGIVTVHDFGTVETARSETAYIVMELLQGESLSERVQRTGQQPVGTAVEIIRQVASALDTAHRAGVLHRDLKSENIYLVPDPATPSGERVKVLDFGLAKLGASQHTAANTVFGTPRYMSPEQCRSATAIDERSDIYSLGCVFFELLTGRTPFLGELRQLLDAHKRSIAPVASTFAAEIPAPVDALIAQMLAKDPAQRPHSMAELHDTLYSINSIGQRTPSSIPRDPDAFASGAFTAVRALPVLPTTAETVLPTPIEFLAMKTDPVHAVPQPLPRKPRAPVLAPGDLASQVISLPKDPSVKYHLAPHLPSLTRSPVRASVMSAAITFLIAAALTAIAARGHIKPAAADPPPATPGET